MSYGCHYNGGHDKKQILNSHFSICIAMSNGYSNRFVSFQTEDRQWDARFNVQLETDLDQLLAAAQREWSTGKLKYIFISGIEIGTKDFQDDFNIRHVHVCLIYVNRVSKKSILKNLDIKQGNGYYLVPYGGVYLGNLSVR